MTSHDAARAALRALFDAGLKAADPAVWIQRAQRQRVDPVIGAALSCNSRAAVLCDAVSRFLQL